MHPRLARIVLLSLLVVILVPQTFAQRPCGKSLSASVAALNQPFMLNRLGASVPSGQIFALTSDIVPKNCTGTGCLRAYPANQLVPGQVMLRTDKRPRPFVLRINEGDCLNIAFYNLLTNAAADPQQPTTRQTSLHLAGLNWRNGPSDDASWVGGNFSSLAPSGTTAPVNPRFYSYYAAAPGVFYMYSTAANFGSPIDLQVGMIGAVIVEPPNSEWFRSQVTRADFDLAASFTLPGGLPRVNYDAVYPSGHPRQGMPILRMVDANNNIVYSDIHAIIAGPRSNNYLFPPGTFPPNYSEPAREQPYREFVILYHDVLGAGVQAFPDFYSPTMSAVLSSGRDNFGINYGTGGIGAEVLANRYGVGPMGACADCRFEEFFLSAWSVGDPAMVVDIPANAGVGAGSPTPCANSTTGVQSNALNCFANCPITGTSPQSAACTAIACPNPKTAYPPCDFSKGTWTSGVPNDGTLRPLRKATKALYPDDPSNVSHSYLNDHTIFRILHGGVGPTHVHHQHAHQWLHSPNNDDSQYLDSQMISPGAAYTLEMVFNGAGNRNKTIGDSIFHCHFYPHFAAGMWGMWRVHDVFERGTLLDANGRPAPGFSRALPDGEIAAGAPIPAIVPMPSIAMAPMPADTQIVPVVNPGTTDVVGYRAEVRAGDTRNPGYPLFIPGIAGMRPPHPPLDFAVDPTLGTLDGGLPRHLILTGRTKQVQTPLDFSKDNSFVNAYRLPEGGTRDEVTAMNFHSLCTHNTFTPQGTAGLFRTNGLAAAPGAPFANPALDPNTEGPDRNQICTNNRATPLPASKVRRYKAAAFETNIVFNKSGWHFPQSRMVALWQDVLPTVNGARLGTFGAGPTRAPEPIFFRVNSGDAVEYWHTNLVPDYYLMDDFQVKTPTDIIGQHIHLVKFDVTSSDGAANGFNYEDGTFSPEEVVARINAINQCRGLLVDFASLAACGSGNRITNLAPKAPPPEICRVSPTGCPPEWTGAQTTVQRWMADPIKNNQNVDRTLRTVFTHDHFGPSTHQQAGLYGALVVEPEGSRWANNETGAPLGGRTDGGPTSWQAMITNVSQGQGTSAYREFLIALADFQLAYQNNSPTTPSATTGWASPSTAINPPCTVQRSGPFNTCPTGPNPTMISAPPAPLGTASFNYRNEPLAMRLACPGGAATCFPQTPATDLNFVFASNITRNNTRYNSQPVPGSVILPGSTSPQSWVYPRALTAAVFPGDPYTPLLRSYENDDVQIRVVAGAHVFPHSFMLNGNKWFFEPGTPPATNNTGFRNYQSVGISEHFEFLFRNPRTAPPPSGTQPANNFADYLYMTDAATRIPGISEGMWGLLRAYRTPQSGSLGLLPNNSSVAPLPPTSNRAGYSCPPSAPFRTFDVVAVPITANVNTGSLILNNRGPGKPTAPGGARIALANALVYSERANLGRLTLGAMIEPLILRARAGECIALTLSNNFGQSGASGIFSGNVTQSEYGTTFAPSTSAGINAQILSYDVTTSDGMNVGFNRPQTVPITPNTPRTYYWYAGNLSISPTGVITGTPAEFGPINLKPADPLMQNILGLAGSLIIEPADASWTFPNSNSRIAAEVFSNSSGSYSELVLMNQDDLFRGSWTCTNTAGGCVSSGTNIGVSHAINYRNEQMQYRYNVNSVNRLDVSAATSNSLVGALPQTQPPTVSDPTRPVRLRILHPMGSGTQHVMTLHGHPFQEEPWGANSTRVAFNVESQWFGGRDTFGPNDRFDIVLPRAGGNFGIRGSYLFRTMIPGEFQDGMWSIFQVGAPPPPEAQADIQPPTAEELRSIAPQIAVPPPPRGPGELRPEDFLRQEREDEGSVGAEKVEGREATPEPQPPPPQR